ncbi:MAG: O-methyltransferase [Akkermansiaceae bacterium]|nr:O-methyltransferase [Akkermansiaceae bacterium]
MRSETLEFGKYLVGLRKSYTADTAAELDLLESFATGRRVVVEVGVYEGVASRRMADSLTEAGKLLLVDPYFRETKLERMLNISFKEIIAKRTVAGTPREYCFLRETSKEAASKLASEIVADFIFIDARHDYESVLEDFGLWSAKLGLGGVIAFHDSRACPARPEISEDDGPVRLCREISAGIHGPWKMLRQVDSITAFEREPARSA